MQKTIPTEEAKKIEAELAKQGLNFEIGYDKEGLIHICCGEKDENKIEDIITALNIPYDHFYWFGSFASDAIVEGLELNSSNQSKQDDEKLFGAKDAGDQDSKMKTIEVTRFVADGLMEQFSTIQELTEDGTCDDPVCVRGIVDSEVDIEMLFSYVAGQYGNRPTVDDEQEASDQISSFIRQMNELKGEPFIIEWGDAPVFGLKENADQPNGITEKAQGMKP